MWKPFEQWRPSSKYQGSKLGGKTFCFLVANITTHRREIHSWINQQEGDVFCPSRNSPPPTAPEGGPD